MLMNVRISGGSIMKKGTYACIAGGLLLAQVLGGCAAPQQQADRRYFWPQLPERPRIEWLKSYSSSNDFPKEGMNKLMSDVLGDEDAITFERPLDVMVDDKQQVFIADPGQQNVIVFDLAGNRARMLTRPEAKGDSLEQPVSLTQDDQNNIYVGDMGTKRVYVIDNSGKILRSFGVEPNLVSVGGLAFDKIQKRLVVADTRGHKIAFFTLQGAFISSFGSRGDGDGQFLYPNPIRFNHKNELLVGDTMNARIQIFDANGKFLRKFGSRGDGPHDFQVLKGVAVDSENNIFITDGKGHKVVIYNNEGDYLLTFGGLFSSVISGKEAMGGFVMPQGIFIDKADRIYVVDQLNHRFQVFQYISDEFLKRNPIKGYPPSAPTTGSK
jgi:DNA-binding beta-propeller fold protein YncE